MTLRTSSCGFFWPAVWSSVGGKPLSFSVVLKHWVMVAVLLAPIKAHSDALYDADTAKPIENAAKSLINDSAATEASENSVFSFWPWASGEENKPPDVKHYKIPTMSGDSLDFKAKPPALIKAPKIDADAVYQYVLDCYPEASKWKLDVNLRGQIASTPDSILSSDGTNSTELGSSYVAIVASLPIYSSKELNREKERESMRRQLLAGTVADFIAGIASRNHAIRELALIPQPRSTRRTPGSARHHRSQRTGDLPRKSRRQP